ncbi:Gldg family protein [Mucilaginibacter auburnensis]|uniref:ABC-2 type transport system permease protein n=1 Tax=Mucilaginibacter auburnensis TaxID=1457233 RepID=A0A2H9VW19_9SPHI|nr:Gldg family protein [Mucilaginibacter auburnensis]PJJ85024.1 ABC-2 type transport system permease protein [Mucilaginibacter auburnensis]
MKSIIDVARIELQKIFYSPIAWLILIAFALHTALLFMLGLNYYINSKELGFPIENITFDLFANQNGGLIPGLAATLFMYLPLVTMGLLSQEFSSGSINLLYSSPVTNLQIVLGKFFCMMIFNFLMVMLVVPEVLFGVLKVENFDLPVVLTGLLGLYLMMCTYAAIGLFMSSLTSYQIGAAIGTLAVLAALTFVDRVWQDVEFVRDVTFWLSVAARVSGMLSGLVLSVDVVYLIVIPALFIAFTVFRLKVVREKTTRTVSLMRYVGSFLLVAIIGYICSLPALVTFYDSTQAKVHTLTKESQRVMAKLKGKVHITTYVNLFEWGNFVSPSTQKLDMLRYDVYNYFYPNIKYEYKYYYAIQGGPYFINLHKSRFKGLTLDQTIEKVANTYEVDKDIFRPGEDFKNEIDLAAEQNTYVAKITTEDGKSTLLRSYYDGEKFPAEAQTTAAFKRLVMALPKAGFVTGHQERTLNDIGPRSYSMLASDKKVRRSLINNGMDISQGNLSSPVPESIDILVIADAKTPYTAQEIKNLNDYIDRGGNLVVACDLNRQEVMNPLVARLGVSFLPGQVVEHNRKRQMDEVTSAFTKEGRKMAYHFELSGLWIPMPGTVAITYKPVTGFKYTPMLETDSLNDFKLVDSVGSWNERTTKNFIDEVPKYDPEKGDVAGPIITGLALSRSVGHKKQKIVIFGDADWLANGLIQDTKYVNSKMAAGVFYWLSDNKVPIDDRRPAPIDNDIRVRKADAAFLNYLYKFIIPGLMGAAFVIIWLRRKRR